MGNEVQVSQAPCVAARGTWTRLMGVVLSIFLGARNGVYVTYVVSFYVSKLNQNAVVGGEGDAGIGVK